MANSLDAIKKYVKKAGSGLKFGTNVGLKSQLSSATKYGSLKNLRDNLPAINKALKEHEVRLRQGRHFSDKEIKKIYNEILASDKNLTKEDKRETKLLLKYLGQKSKSDRLPKGRIINRDTSYVDEMSQERNRARNVRVSGLASGLDRPSGGFASQLRRDRHDASALSHTRITGNVGGGGRFVNDSSSKSKTSTKVTPTGGVVSDISKQSGSGPRPLGL